jgi:hypothetical protein
MVEATGADVIEIGILALFTVAQDPGLPVAVSRASVTNNCLAKTESCVIPFQMTGSDGGRRGEGKRAGSQATGPAWNILREENFYLNQP